MIEKKWVKNWKRQIENLKGYLPFRIIFLFYCPLFRPLIYCTFVILSHSIPSFSLTISLSFSLSLSLSLYLSLSVFSILFLFFLSLSLSLSCLFHTCFLLFFLFFLTIPPCVSFSFPFSLSIFICITFFFQSFIDFLSIFFFLSLLF